MLHLSNLSGTHPQRRCTPIHGVAMLISVTLMPTPRRC